jgi:tetratricopeptide (TPR) repeat protein
LQKTVATDVKFVHVVRNPYDNVAATLKRYLVHIRNPALSAIVEDYFALLALGDLYSQWGRKDEAIVAYEQVLKRDPDPEEAENRLEELRG